MAEQYNLEPQEKPLTEEDVQRIIYSTLENFHGGAIRSGKIGDWTIEGTKISSSTSGKRIILDSENNRVDIHDAAGLRVRLTDSTLTFFRSGGSVEEGSITSGSDFTTIKASSQLNLVSGGFVETDGDGLVPNDDVQTLGDSATSNRWSDLFIKKIALVDGITAPSSVSGLARIYVDTSDGDLKIIFGDGTVKTIVTDT